MNTLFKKGTLTRLGLIVDYLFPVPEREYDQEDEKLPNTQEKHNIEKNLRIYT